MVCVADENYEAMLRHYAHVLVGRVDSRSETASGPEFRLSSIRVWKGDKKSIVLRNTNGTCGKYPALGRVYLVFAASDPQDVTMCSPALGVWESRAKVAITRLDRSRHLPPLSLPPEDLK